MSLPAARGARTRACRVETLLDACPLAHHMRRQVHLAAARPRRFRAAQWGRLATCGPIGNRPWDRRSRPRSRASVVKPIRPVRPGLRLRRCVDSPNPPWPPPPSSTPERMAEARWQGGSPAPQSSVVATSLTRLRMSCATGQASRGVSTRHARVRAPRAVAGRDARL